MKKWSLISGIAFSLLLCPALRAGEVQTASGQGLVPFVSATAAGDVIMVGFAFPKAAVVISVTDSQANLFSEVGTQLNTSGGSGIEVWYAQNIKGGNDTVTVKFQGSVAYSYVYITEYGNVATSGVIDSQAGASGSAGAVSSGLLAKAAVFDTLYGFCVADGTCSAGTGFTPESTYAGNLVEDEILGTAGSYAATAQSNSGWAMQAVALKPAGSSAVAPIITSASTASGTIGVPFSYQITASGLPTSFTALGLPSGLTVNVSTGLITGIPTGFSSNSSITIGATNSTGTGNHNLAITISAAAGLVVETVVITGTFQIPAMTLSPGQYYTATVAAPGADPSMSLSVFSNTSISTVGGFVPSPSGTAQIYNGTISALGQVSIVISNNNANAISISAFTLNWKVMNP